MERVSKQLILSTQSGRLKPDVRLGVAVSEFAETLDEDRKREFQKMQTAGTQLSGRDAIRVTEELNRDSEWRHSACRPYGTKCGKFLDRLQTLANIGDVMIGGSQNVIATSIWCAVRLALQTATNYRGYFEKLSSLFMKLGTSWDLHNDFAQIFPQSRALQTFLCEYLIVLMRLCRKTVAFSNKSFAGQVWSSLGASFDSEFKPLQEEMDKWGLLIQHKTQQLATACVVDTEMFRRRDYKQRILRLLSPNQSQHITAWRRHRKKGDCKWIYETAAYKSWIAEDESSTLCISGKLGSGKTVMMANIVAQISMHQTCAFFFCTFKDQESLKARAVLGSIAFHQLDSIPGDDSTWDDLSRQGDTSSRLLTSAGIIDLLMDVPPENAKYVLVFDGLEDCPSDEITEVIYGLRRLMACRIILLCYSARSGSMFQRLTVQQLAPKFSVSLDDEMHDGEIKAYITEEIARRKQTSQPGLFSDELVELVKQQLLAGAQGMYLWVSLQLDSIFPSQSRTVVTYEQILNLINNLPKDLPETFERALEEIIDDRYGDSIMKLVMAAPSPLSLDELRVALAVVPGDPVWYPSKVPTNASQLISLCGGNLLELDEEDEKVRFIHYSVVSHLLQPTKNPRTMLYHFTLQEAMAQSGAICVTFLNMPLFESAVTTTRKIDGERLAEEVIGTATHAHPLLGHLAHLFKKTDRRHSRSTDFDIGRLLAEIQAARMLSFDPHCFQKYAVSNWLTHCGAFQKKTPLCVQIWHLWMRLLRGNIQVAKPPFQSPVEDSWPALSWALKHHCEVLVCAIIEEPTTEPTDGERISQGIIELASPPLASRWDRSTLGLILVHLFQLATNILTASPKFEGDHSIVDQTNASGSKVPWKLLYQSLQRLLDLGADHTMPHSRNGNNVLQMLLATLGCISETTFDGRQLSNLLTRILIRDNTPPLLRSAWVPYALRRILENDNTQIFLRLLSHSPELHLGPEEDSLIGVAVFKGNLEAVRVLVEACPLIGSGPGYASYINGQPAIQLALERQDKKIVTLLARRGGLRDSYGKNKFSVPLLQIALERLSTERLLENGFNIRSFAIIFKLPLREIKH
ncbi:hypothetical protein INS49_002625 [Diaporthe citri]|uniref:uncharacterized protein n=1 Tax=Diaporthe citri TaxID=83186 RepID=UPI001C7EF997|nr:uncharacterized protein INS49_002625 [Diaporthe citri]KAG6368418.1 hypothetical protein INS49_002625 [Diaporthe citri]